MPEAVADRASHGERERLFHAAIFHAAGIRAHNSPLPPAARCFVLGARTLADNRRPKANDLRIVEDSSLRPLLPPGKGAKFRGNGAMKTSKGATKNCKGATATVQEGHEKEQERQWQ
jgi:hypothetical protein